MKCPFYNNWVLDKLVPGNCIYLEVDGSCEDIDACTICSDAWCVKMINKGLSCKPNIDTRARVKYVLRKDKLKDLIQKFLDDNGILLERYDNYDGEDRYQGTDFYFVTDDVTVRVDELDVL